MARVIVDLSSYPDEAIKEIVDELLDALGLAIDEVTIEE